MCSYNIYNYFFKCFSTNSVSLLLLIVIFSIQELLERLCSVYEQELKGHYNDFTGGALSDDVIVETPNS